MARRTIQDWVVRPMLRSIRGVAEVNSIGGHVKEYQVLVDPNRLRHYDLTLAAVDQALASNNANASGNILPLHAEQYLIRGVGLIRILDDIRNIVLKEREGVPIYVRDVAEVQFGGEVRLGASIKDGYTESVTGIVMMLRGGNAKDIVGRVKEKVRRDQRAQACCRTDSRSCLFMTGPLWWMRRWTRSTRYLIEALVFVILVMVICLGNLRVSLVVCATLIITPLVTFMIMNYYGIPANLMSLGGLTIAIGLMVDPTVVVVENIFLRLSHAPTGRAKDRDNCQGSSRGGRASNIWHYHHCAGLPAADVAAGHGGKDVQPARCDHLHRVAGGVGRFGGIVARTVRLHAERRKRERHQNCRCPQDLFTCVCSIWH